MMKKITLLFVFAMVAASSVVAQSFTALYAFDSVKASSTNPPVTGSGLTDPSPVPTATGMTFGSFSAAVTTATNPNAGGRFSFTDWPTGATASNDTYSAHTGSLSTTQYYEVTLTPAVGFTASLTGIMFRTQRSGSGIRTYSVRSSADTYAANLNASIMPTNANLSVQANNVFYWNLDATTSGQNGSVITLAGANYTNFTTPITFRFYGWNAEGSGGTFSIDSVKFMGSVSGTTSISDIATVTSAVVYPNPSTDGMFAVNTVNGSGLTSVTVYNIIGKVVYTKEINGDKGLIDLSSEANGSYFVAIKNNAGTVTRKIVINK